MKRTLGLAVASMFVLAACGGGGGGGGGTAPSTHSVSGPVQGLTANGLVLTITVDNQTEVVAIPANATSFQFPTRIAHGASYVIGVRSQPTGQACGVGGIRGTAQADVTNINVNCSNLTAITVTASAGPHGSISPSGAVTVYYGDDVEFTATPDPGYVVDDWEYGGDVRGASDHGTRLNFFDVYGASSARVTFRPAMLTASVETLALSVNDVATDAALTGTPRNIVITNNSQTTTATNLSVSLPTLPSGAIWAYTCGPTLLPGATCSITITPGSAATSTCASRGAFPIPDIVTVTANEDPWPVSVRILVLGYGCIFQGGHIFAIDDTTPVTSSIGGKVAAETDIPYTIVWSPNDQLVGVGRNSQSPCVSDADGECNSTTILAHYAAEVTTIDFAAQACARLNGNVQYYLLEQLGWYLPAHCEMADCGAGRPSIQTNLWARNNLGSLSGQYWTSTEAANAPTTQAQSVSFQSTVTTQESSKRQQSKVRCIRKLN